MSGTIAVEKWFRTSLRLSDPGPAFDPIKPLFTISGSTSSRRDSCGQTEAHARALWRALYRELDSRWAYILFLPPLRRWVEARGQGGHPRKLQGGFRVPSGDGATTKLLLRLRMDGRSDGGDGISGPGPACLSTQAGCAMGCVFCATGQMGFVPQPASREISSPRSWRPNDSCGAGAARSSEPRADGHG